MMDSCRSERDRGTLVGSEGGRRGRLLRRSHKSPLGFTAYNLTALYHVPSGRRVSSHPPKEFGESTVSLQAMFTVIPGRLWDAPRPIVWRA
jgi:hypothetical protein